MPFRSYCGAHVKCYFHVRRYLYALLYVNSCKLFNKFVFFFNSNKSVFRLCIRLSLVDFAELASCLETCKNCRPNDSFSLHKFLFFYLSLTIILITQKSTFKYINYSLSFFSIQSSTVSLWLQVNDHDHRRKCL